MLFSGVGELNIIFFYAEFKHIIKFPLTTQGFQVAYSYILINI